MLEVYISHLTTLLNTSELEPCADVILSAAAFRVILTGGGGAPIDFLPAAAAFVGVTGSNNRAYTLGDRRAEVRPCIRPLKHVGLVLPFSSHHAHHGYNYLMNTRGRMQNTVLAATSKLKSIYVGVVSTSVCKTPS